MSAIRGRLVTESFAATELRTVRGMHSPPPGFVAALDAWAQRCEQAIGPASGVRAIADVVAIPLLQLLGYRVTHRGMTGSLLDADAGATRLPVIVTPWAHPLDGSWRTGVLEGIRSDYRWCCCCNGVALRLVDTSRTWTRRHLEFDLAQLATDDLAQRLIWGAARADAMAARPPVLDVASDLSARHGVAVCGELGRGVLAALNMVFETLRARDRVPSPAVLFDQSLTVVYRVLFLLFAEARGLVPMWHPVYRAHYSIGQIVDTLLQDGRCRGLWHAVQAISRLAHAGCAAGELKVTAFNGRLFAPSAAAAFDRVRMSDTAIGRAILAVSTATTRGRERERISYRDLDVEQLGAVYERVLEHSPDPATGVLASGADTRKTTASFYTPRALTSWLVRQTLEPLVRGRTTEAILNLRVLDPAMGSGAFLVAACRYLAAAVEDALIAEGQWHAGDVTAADRASLRRTIAQRCLFGVDRNPMAVQLARLSLWLTTLAADRPLTFLDHRLVAGDSLVGAAVADLQRQPPGSRARGSGPRPLPLFEMPERTALHDAVPARLGMSLTPDDTAAVVRDKEKLLAAIDAPGSPLARWRRVLDLWCACWFLDDGRPPQPAVFGELCSYILNDRSSLPAQTAHPLLEQADAIAARHCFLHWPFTFPEVFFDAEGTPRSDAGFDAIVGNPPWDMVRGDSGEDDVRAGRRADARLLTAFVRDAGIYRTESRAHANRYQLFLERALQLVCPGGRIGMILPSGIVADAGAAPLRRHLFDRAAVDSVVGFENRAAIFPIHRSVKFVLLTCTSGRPTTDLSCRFGLTSADDLDRPLDSARGGPERPSMRIPRRLLERVSGTDDLGIPELASARDLAILERISANVPWLSAADGWNARFGRELNATDDRRSFRPITGDPNGRPILEGKQIEPFRTNVGGSRHELVPGAAVKHVPRRARLAYRDIASATNRLTLIAAVIPARVVTTHTLFCLKSPLTADAQHVLCALLNSLVANYLVRMRVNTHVTVALMSRLPVPLSQPTDATFSRLLALSRGLASGVAPADQMPEYPELQALVAQLYGLSAGDFARVLETFPLLAPEMKAKALLLFNDSQ